MNKPQSKKLHLELGDRSYPILIGLDTWNDESLKRLIDGRRALIVSNTTISPLYMNSFLACIDDTQTEQLILEDGERYKTLDTLQLIYNKLLQGKFDRSSVLIALGGGVIGDMVGFAAATYQRGINFIQIPTTLLAQVDSSVGGKTAVNHPLGKNMIGAFHQPKAVFIDPSTLNTLPDREFSAGMAEVIKYGLIRDISFFDWLETNIEALMTRDAELLAEAIRISCQTKAEIVAADETERGQRALLNLGHTFGHAIESAQGYQEWLHGEAVGAGMAMAARMSESLGWLNSEDVARTENLLTAAGLPIRAPDNIAPEKLRDLMSHDKKVERGQLRLVLMKSIGEAIIFADFEEDLLLKTLTEG